MSRITTTINCMLHRLTILPRYLRWINRFGLTFLLVFGCEFAVMVFLPLLDLPEGIYEALLDSTLLALLVIPGLYLLGLVVGNPSQQKNHQDETKNNRTPSKTWHGLLSLRNQYLAILIALSVVPLLWLGWNIDKEISQELQADAIGSASASLNHVSRSIRHDLKMLRNDARAITLYPPVAGLIRCWDNGGIDPLDGTTEAIWRSQLETLFLAHASTHLDVVQTRFLDEAGRERVRVNVVDGTPQIVPMQQLQDKSDRYYFKDAITLPKGRCYVSPIDLNVEHGVIEVPHRPMLRVASPVWAKGRARGVIIINVTPKTILDRVQAHNNGKMILANHTGTYLHHPDVSRQWANQLGGDANIFRDWPTIRRLRKREGHGVLETSDKALVWIEFPIDPNDTEKNWLLGVQWNRDELFVVSKKLKHTVIDTCLGVGALALVVALIMAAAWGRPVTRLAIAARKLGEGDYDVRVPVRRRDELGDMGQAFNSMAQMIGRHTKELGRQVEKRTSELWVTATVAEELRKQADIANQSKSEFLANMSHEIRTPMTAILGFAETLLEPDLSDSDRIEASHTIQSNGKYLLSLINDILDLSKIEAGKMTIEKIPCSVCKIVADVASLMSIRTKEKKLSFNFEYLGPVPETIYSDPIRLRQILINLIGNAIKFTDKGGVRLIIRLVELENKSQLQFDILDTGIGMSEKQVKRLFRPFTQADASTTRNFGGTGLGLMISRKFSQMLGGDIIIVESVEGVGTRFRATVDTGPLEGVKMIEDPMTNVQAADQIEQAHSDDDQSILDGCRVLLAEDVKVNQKLIAHVLSKYGASVTVADNGQIAVEKAQASRNNNCPFDVILMDMQMPVMDGYEATSTLRKQGWAAPIIALTAHAMATDRDKCIQAGCDDHATKPIDRKKLIACIHEHISKSRAA